jgi:hypothetical protein
MMRTLLAFVTLVFMAGLAGSAEASAPANVDPKWVLIVAKALDFVTRKPVPPAKVIVVGDAADLAVARSSFGKMEVAAGTVGDAAGAFAIIVNTPEEARAAHAANANVAIIGNNEPCVEVGACLIAVETQPKVSIYVSRAAALAAGIEFDPNFKMMITEK